MGATDWPVVGEERQDKMAHWKQLPSQRVESTKLLRLLRITDALWFNHLQR